jgi:hypothetical protein
MELKNITMCVLLYSGEKESALNSLKMKDMNEQNKKVLEPVIVLL